MQPEAMLRLRRGAGGSLDDDALLLAMARQVLGGPRDEGRSSYQVSLSVCGACGSGAQRAGGELAPVEAAVVEMAACDAQHLGEIVPPVGEIVPPAAEVVPPAAEVVPPGAELMPRGDEHRAANENASTGAAPHEGAESRAHDALAEPSSDETAATRQSSDHVHVGAPNPRVGDAATDTAAVGTSTTPPLQAARAAADTAHSSPRAKQSIPPALRRAVLTRDRHCRVPGCSHATFVDVHHVQPRAEGGRNEASNLLTLCGAHHRAAHRGQLLIEREHDGSLIFRHGDGAAYGSPTAPRLIDAHAKVFSALRHLGFREAEVKAVLAKLRADAELDAVSVERLLREALCRIRPAAR
jgi:RuvA, C-terminal domain/HNH endonuclease